MNKVVFVGLGNPGKKFEHTRHNVGIDILRVWVEMMKGRGATVSNWKEEQAFNAEIAEVALPPVQVECIFPLTFMNDAGRAVGAHAAFYNITPQNILIIHDDLELPLGEVSIKEEGSAHGHNGVRSIHQQLSTDKIRRLRIGIGRPLAQVPVEEYVLQQFTTEEQPGITQSIHQAALLLEEQAKILAL
ncbi:MAG: aminoacyl-tRNA hydrolase [Candidatus Andersenbacteria bacterium]